MKRKILFIETCTLKWEKNQTLNAPGLGLIYVGKNLKAALKSVAVIDF
jgi:hypothetical protein